MKVKILKRMISSGEILEVGDLVEVDSWRNTRSLINARYIKLVEEEKIAEVQLEEAIKVAPKKKTSKAKVE